MKYTEIIDKYLDGEMTSQEEATFEAQVKTNPDLADEIKLHQLAIVGIQHIQETRSQETKVLVANIEKEESPHKAVTNQPKSEGSIVPMWIRRNLLPIAAMLLLIPAIYFIIPSSPNPLKDTSIALIKHYEGTTMGENNPDKSEKTILLTGIENFKQKDYSTAITSFDQVIEKNPKERPSALFLKADALYRLGKKDEAKTVLKEVLKENDETLKKKVRVILDKL